MICDNFFFLEIAFDTTPSKPPNWTSILSATTYKKIQHDFDKEKFSLSLSLSSLLALVTRSSCSTALVLVMPPDSRSSSHHQSSIVQSTKPPFSSKPWISSPFELSHICTTDLFFYLFIHRWWGWESRQRKGGMGRRILIWGSYKLESSGGGL